MQLYKCNRHQALKTDSKNHRGPARVAQLVGAWPRTPKGCRLDYQPGHIPRLPVPSPVGVHTGCNRSMFPSHNEVCLSVCLSPSSSLPKSISKKKKERKKEKNHHEPNRPVSSKTLASEHTAHCSGETALCVGLC